MGPSEIEGVLRIRSSALDPEPQTLNLNPQPLNPKPLHQSYTVTYPVVEVGATSWGLWGSGQGLTLKGPSASYTGFRVWGLGFGV